MKHKLIMENWRKFKDGDELVNENFNPDLIRISPNFKPQGTFSRLKSRFTRKKGDETIDQETGKSKLRRGDKGQQFQFVAFYKTPDGRNEPEVLGDPIDYADKYKGTISSEEDIVKLLKFIMTEDDSFDYRLSKATKKMNERFGKGWKLNFVAARPNDLIGPSMVYGGAWDWYYVRDFLKKFR